LVLLVVDRTRVIFGYGLDERVFSCLILLVLGETRVMLGNGFGERVFLELGMARL